MKIIICGKGGSGKSTISALIANGLAKTGFNVLLIDADESNTGLHRLMGESSPLILMDDLGGKKKFKQKLNKPFGFDSGIFSKQTISLKDIPSQCNSKTDGIKLLSIGKIHSSGEGCACPMGILSKMILSKLVIGDKEIVLIDSSAGIEHFGRGIDEKCDLIINVVDPSFESFLLSKKITAMATEAETEICYILNKMDDRVTKIMLENIDQTKVAAKINQDETIFMSGLKGEKLNFSVPEIDPVCRLIEEQKRA